MYASCFPMTSAMEPYIRGSTALPQNDITRIALPRFFHFPRFLIANGQIPAYINEFGNPKRTRQTTEAIGGRNSTSTDRNIPKDEQTFNAVAWLIARGIIMIPQQ